MARIGAIDVSGLGLQCAWANGNHHGKLLARLSGAAHGISIDLVRLGANIFNERQQKAMANTKVRRTQRVFSSIISSVRILLAFVAITSYCRGQADSTDLSCSYPHDGRSSSADADDPDG